MEKYDKDHLPPFKAGTVGHMKPKPGTGENACLVLGEIAPEAVGSTFSDACHSVTLVAGVRILQDPELPTCVWAEDPEMCKELYAEDGKIYLGKLDNVE